MTTTHDESLHPREPEGTGRFGAKGQGEPGFELPTPTPSPKVTATLRRQYWQGDYAIEIDHEDFDVETILDTMTLDEVRELDGSTDLDELYFSGVRLGLVEGGAGPFDLELDDETFVAYIEAREAGGQEGVVSAPARHTKKERRAAVANILGDAYKTIPTHWVLTGPSQKAVKNAFGAAAADITLALKEQGIAYADLDFKDREAFASVANIAAGADPRGGTFKDQAAYASALLANWIISRDETLRAVDELD